MEFKELIFLGLRFERWAIFVLFFSCNAMLPVYASICDEASTGTHSTAVQFTFTNAGVAQTQSKGRLNTAPNYLPCLRGFSFVKLVMHAIWVQLGDHF